MLGLEDQIAVLFHHAMNSQERKELTLVRGLAFYEFNVMPLLLKEPVFILLVRKGINAISKVDYL